MIEADPDLETRVLRAAEEAFAKVMAGVPEQLETMPPDLDADDAIRWAGDRVTELLANLAELPLESLLGPAEQAVEDPVPDGFSATDSRPPTGVPLSVRASAGEVTEARVWVHPVGDLGPGDLHFLLSDLVAPSGESISGELAGFAPAHLTTPLRAGAATLLQLEVPPGTARGSYHGHVLARGAADAAVPITVTLT